MFGQPIHDAAQLGDVAGVKAALSAGVNMETHDSDVCCCVLICVAVKNV